jgi:tetratricopeptide (TPR) repeat protein
MIRVRALRLAFVLLLSLLVGCSVLGARLDISEVDAALARAQADLDQGRTEDAVSLMRRASLAEDLSPEQRAAVERLLEAAVRKRIVELSGERPDAGELADLVQLDLPRQVAVEAGLAAARAWQKEGEEGSAFEVLQLLDKKYPLHYERVAAGDLIVELGLAMSKRKERFLIFYDTDEEAQKMLEYAILEHPWARNCDQAYLCLAQLYEQDREFKLAIDRLEKLVLNHPDSQERAAAQARIPRLRLRLLASPEYDRAMLLTASQELRRWLAAHPEHSERDAVEHDLGDCMRRLVDNDLVIARFYERVGNVYGARRHATRAVLEARDAGDTPRAQAAQRFLDSLPGEDAQAKRPHEDLKL